MMEVVKIEVNFYLLELINSLIKIIKFLFIKEYKWNIILIFFINGMSV